jgi:hypothetical protein
MTGKVIDSGANGFLIALLPLALAMIVLFVAWPLFVGLFVLGLAWKLWQTYQWQQLSKKINPSFNQLVQANQGCLTVLDMSLKANIDAGIAKWYLERKAEEYGAICRLYEDRGIVYYFLTASALGSIFEDSEPESEAELAPLKTPSLPTPLPVDEAQEVEPETTRITKETEVVLTTDTKVTENISPEPGPASESETQAESPSLSLNQSELAKRLDLSSSTIGKRKLEPDFSLWSQTKDPDGIAWEYMEETKVFIPLESEPSSS